MILCRLADRRADQGAIIVARVFGCARGGPATPGGEMSNDNNNSRSAGATLSVALQFAGNRLLASLNPTDRAILEPAMSSVLLNRGDVLFEPGEDVSHTYFPGPGVVAS